MVIGAIGCKTTHYCDPPWTIGGTQRYRNPMKNLNSSASTGAAHALWTFPFLHILLTDLIIFASAQMLRPVIPLYVASIGGNKPLVGIVASAFMFSAVILRPLSGLAVDSLGRKTVLIASVALFAAAGAILPLGLAIPGLIGVRILQGIAWSGAPPATNTIMSELIPASRRGEGLGYTSMTRNLGIALGPAIGIYLAEDIGFWAAFTLSAALAFAALGVASKVHSPYVPPAEAKLWSVRGLIEPHALLPASISALMNFVVSGMITFVPLDAQERNIGSAITFFVAISMLLMIIRPVVGGLSDRLPRRGSLLIPGLVFVGLSALVLALTETVWTLPLAALFWAIGFGTTQPVLRAMILDRVPRNRWGSANATNMMLYDTGHAMGPLVLGFIAKRFPLATTFGFSAIAPFIAILLIFITKLHLEESPRNKGE